VFFVSLSNADARIAGVGLFFWSRGLEVEEKFAQCVNDDRGREKLLSKKLRS
jgi:hypothetical protein